MSVRESLPAAILPRLERLQVLSRRAFRGAGHGSRRARTHGASTELRDHRLYAPGDDLRHLDWTLLARLDRLYLKRFHDQQDVTVHLVVDASASMGHGAPVKLHAAAAIAAALGHLSLAGLDRVRAHAIAGAHEGRAASTPPLLGRQAEDVLLAWLDALRPAGAARLDDALTAVGRTLRTPGIVVVLSDFLADGAREGLHALAAGRHAVHAVQVLAPQELSPSLEGDLRLVDCETGAEVAVSLSPRLLRLHADALAELESLLSEAARRVGATHVRVTSDVPVEDVVFRHLQAAGVVG